MASIEPLTSVDAYRRTLKTTLDMLDEVMSSEPDMPGHAQTMANADQWLDAVRIEMHRKGVL